MVLRSGRPSSFVSHSSVVRTDARTNRRLTFALLQTLQTSREERPGLLDVTPPEVMFAEQSPDFGALPKLFASSLVSFFRFLLRDEASNVFL